jgi:hypothetical protein
MRCSLVLSLREEDRKECVRKMQTSVKKGGLGITAELVSTMLEPGFYLKRPSKVAHKVLRASADTPSEEVLAEVWKRLDLFVLESRNNPLFTERQGRRLLNYRHRLDMPNLAAWHYKS